MNGIVIATLVLAVSGILVGIGLVFFNKKFYVAVDERETKVRECLPGNNCGACGYAGCDAMAAAIASGEAPVNGCPVGGAPVAAKVGEVMGVAVDGTAEDKKAAFVKCIGSCQVTQQKANYAGIMDCRAAALSGLQIWECEHGCLGFGSCAAVCPEEAITVKDGVAHVDPDKCIACGKCIKECPQKIIEFKPVKNIQAVQCSSTEKGMVVRKQCSAGCIACHLCEKQCEHDAIHVVNDIAHIDYEKCVGCNKCAEKCPAHVIISSADAKPVVKTAGQ